MTNGTPKQPAGKWVRSMGTRWWEGGCTCGSGRDGEEVYDHHGIYFGISCTSCNRKPRELGPGEDWEEQIEEDY